MAVHIAKLYLYLYLLSGKAPATWPLGGSLPLSKAMVQNVMTNDVQLLLWYH